MRSERRSYVRLCGFILAALLVGPIGYAADESPAEAPIAEAHAESPFVFLPSVRYVSEKVTDTSGIVGNADYGALAADLKFGYVLRNYVYVGPTLRIESSTASVSGAKGYAAGISAGYLKDQFAAIATLHGYAERRYTTNGIESRLAAGLGYQIDAAYLPEIFPGLRFGPQLTYRWMKFTRTQFGTASESDRGVELAVFEPVLAFAFRF